MLLVLVVGKLNQGAVHFQHQTPGSTGAGLVCRILGASPAFPPVRFTLLTSPCHTKQAVVGSGCFALEPNSAIPRDGDDPSGGGRGGTQKAGRELLKHWGFGTRQRNAVARRLSSKLMYMI